MVELIRIRNDNYRYAPIGGRQPKYAYITPDKRWRAVKANRVCDCTGSGGLGYYVTDSTGQVTQPARRLATLDEVKQFIGQHS